jgi:hypothetical protein
MSFELNKKDNLIVNLEHQDKDGISEILILLQFRDQDNFDIDDEKSSDKFGGL